MLLAMCADTGMLLSALFFLMLAGILCCVPFVFTVILILKWVNARRERRAAEAALAANV